MSINNNQEHQEQGYMDSAMQIFHDSLPKIEETGESPVEKMEGNEDLSSIEKIEDELPAGEKGPESSTREEPVESPKFDVNKFLEESSEGLLKNEDDIKNSISKIKDYDTLVQKIKVLESEQETIFANDSIRKLNALVKEGKSEEQIDGYIKLSKINLDSISAKDVLIENEILNNGHTRKIAEKLVDKKYGLDSLSFNEEVLTAEEIEKNKSDLEIAEALMAKDAKAVKESFKEQLDGLSQLVSPEQKAIDEAARKRAYEKQLEPFADHLTKDFPRKLPLRAGETELTYDIPEEFISTIKSEAIAYFNHPDIEVNEKTVNEFLTLKKALFLYKNQQQINTHFFEQGKSQGIKETTDNFVNNGGLENPTPDVQVTLDNIDESLMQIARS